MKVVLLFSVQYVFWLILTMMMVSWTARAWWKKQHRLFGMYLTITLCTATMLVKLLLI